MGLLKKIILIAILSAIVLLFICLGIPIGVIIAYWNDLPSLEPLEYETHSWQYPTKVYSDVARLTLEMSIANLLERLDRLEYDQVDHEPTEGGQFFIRDPVESPTNELKLYLRKLDYPRFARFPRLISIEVRSRKIATIKNETGVSLNEFFLEPEVIAEFYGSEGTDRELVSLSQMPDHLTRAFTAIEDKRFYRHWGFDLHRITGLAYRNIRYRRIVGGASTITQQLARMLFLTRDETLKRKIKEALLAIKIEKRYTKDEILERYINRVDFGRFGSRQVYGVGQAAKHFFNKYVWELSISECALLAAIPNNPTIYSPTRRPEKAQRRRQIVLQQMLLQGFITEGEHKEATESALVTMAEKPSSRKAAYFLEYIRAQLENRYGASTLYRRGFRIYTTLDMSMQLAANRAIQKRLADLDSFLIYPRYEDNKAKWFAGERERPVRDPRLYLQAALVSIDPGTGYVKVMVGGRDFLVTQFNRAIKSRRSPGSAFKPFVYNAAFEDNLATPITIVLDEPWEIEDPSQPDGLWKPRNFHERFYGKVTVRKMLTRSINVATARLLHDNIGIDRVIANARIMGIESPLDRVWALALGSSGTSLMEITSAYGVWANQGIRAEPILIKYVLDRESNMLEENRPPAKRVLGRDVAFLTTYLMQGVISEGTGRNVRLLGFKRPAAGKTGTTNEEADAWFIGFVPDLVTGVWVGFDKYGKSIHRSGALAALPIWTDFMKAVVDGPVKDFPVPPGIVFKEVDADTGLPATSRSTNVVKEAFIEGTEPSEE